MNRTSTPAQPETMRMTHKAELADSPRQSVGRSYWNWGRMNLADSPARSVGLSDWNWGRKNLADSPARSSDWNWGRINLDDDDISLTVEDEPASVQSQDAISQMSPPEEPETTRISSVLADDNNDISLRLEGEPASVQSQRANLRSDRRVLTLEVVNSLRNSSGQVEINDIFEWLGREPIPREPIPMLPVRLQVMPLEEIHSFRNSRGQIDAYAIALFQLNNPDRFPPQDNIRPPRQSKGLSGQTISKYLKRMSANKMRAQDIDGDRKICAVCRDDVCGQKRKVAILDECGHEFHYRCLEKWLRLKNICPLCRRTAISNLKDR